MAEKKAKVTKITKIDTKDSYGNTSFIVELDNGDKGFYTSKNEDQKNFIVGSEAEYLIEEKSGKNGNKYFKISLPQKQGFQNGGGGGKYQPQDPKVQMISFAMAYTKDLIVGGKIDIKDLEGSFGRVFDTMFKKLNEIQNGK